MSKAPLRWSWIALAASGIPLGLCLTLGLLFAINLQTGLAADQNAALLSGINLSWIAQGVVGLGLTGLIVIVLAWWISRRFAHQILAFMVAAAALPAAPMALKSVAIIASWATGQISGDASALDQNPLFYPPTYVDPIFIAVSFLTAAGVYVAVEKLTRGWRPIPKAKSTAKETP